MMALDGKNTQVDHIVWAARVLFQVIVGPLTTQRELGTCRYLLHRLLGPWYTLVKALQEIIITSDKDLSSFLVQMATSHWCRAFAFNVSCMINSYLNT